MMLVMGTGARRTAVGTSVKAAGIALVVLLGGCADPAPSAMPAAPEDATTVARIVCEKDGSTSTSTPHVIARSDGVQIRIVNRLEEWVSMNGLGFDVGPGSSDRVAGYPPGSLQVACWPFSDHGPEGSEPVPVAIHVHDPEGLFVDGELECLDEDDGSMLDIRLLASLRGREDVRITPEDARPLIGGLNEDDEVIVPGYPDEVRQSVVVVRDGRRIAQVGFSYEAGRWVQAGGWVCGGPVIVA